MQKRPGKEILCLSMQSEAVAILRQRVPHNRAMGDYLSRLLFEDAVRRQEQERIASGRVEQSAMLG